MSNKVNKKTYIKKTKSLPHEFIKRNSRILCFRAIHDYWVVRIKYINEDSMLKKNSIQCRMESKKI